MKEVRYFYVPDAGNRNELPEEEAAHAVRVLRLKAGDEMFLMDGTGCFYRAVFSLASNKKCLYEIADTLPQEALCKGHIHIGIAPTKDMGRIEWMVEKATEIGVNEFSFLDCRFSERRSIRTQRLDRIVVSAVKQSRKPWMPLVNPQTAFKDFIAQPRSGRKFICHCYEEIPRKDFYNEIVQPVENEDIIVLVGPEGDFSVEEVRLAMQQGYESVTLGAARLRTETAGLYAVMLSQLARRLA